MLEIKSVGPYNIQKFTVATTTGVMEWTMRFMPAVSMWYMDINYKDISVQGIRIHASHNLLRQWQKIIDVGVFCATTIEGYEPTLIDDFYSGRCKLFVTEGDEVSEVESDFIGEDDG